MFFGPELYAGDQKIVCTRCGAHPVMVMLVKGKLEALCLDHAPRRSARGIDIDKRMVF